ncbi:LysR family transcriptional regulator [Alphaproteobacteria bacterium 46_93_T64]|nr:LysR family transcriptional regulator [Alphaproteobacteria bacterium 46_93_T64]
MNSQLAWDDLRLVLAITNSGSLSGAGRKLQMSHATVFRRLGIIEQRIGVRLFDRFKTGYSPTVAGEAMAETARRIETEVKMVERNILGLDHKPSGSIRITTTDTLLAGVLAPILGSFRTTFNDISLEVTVSNETLNLSKREADIAIRPTSRPHELLVGRKISVIRQSIYGLRQLYGDGKNVDIRETSWIGPDEGMSYTELRRWMAKHGFDTQCQYRVDSVLGMYSAVLCGSGIAVLPCYLADENEQLIRIGDTVRDLQTDLWLLTHSDIQNSARIRAFIDFAADAINIKTSSLT